MLRLATALLAAFCILSNGAQSASRSSAEIERLWFGLALDLVRHTPTMSPPVASRAFAYLGIAGYESAASGSDVHVSFAGQLNGLKAVPMRESAATYDEALVMHVVMAEVARDIFSNTGPTGQRALQRMWEKLKVELEAELASDVSARSVEFGMALGTHILNWSRSDGGAVIENLGFPTLYDMPQKPSAWKPTNLISLQQTPLLPRWGQNRTFAMPKVGDCPIVPPPAYSEDPASEFHTQAMDVVQTARALTAEHKAIARFWSDDAMLSPTPPGHWISIAMQIMERDQADAVMQADVLARLSISMADAFIAVWKAKYEYNLLRPVTYIRRIHDPKWESLLSTPPFPEYPSGHSGQSGAAAEVLSAMFGDDRAFDDATHAKDGISARRFKNFRDAASEAAISRLYGGIHFRAAIDYGLEQGRCVGGFAVKLRTRK